MSPPQPGQWQWGPGGVTAEQHQAFNGFLAQQGTFLALLGMPAGGLQPSCVPG